MFSEYDVVSLQSGSDAPGVPIGTRGTILHIYSADPPVYEVEFSNGLEFLNDLAIVYGTFTMQEHDLKLEWKAPPP